MPAIKALSPDEGGKRNALVVLLPEVKKRVLYSYDWYFAIDEADSLSVADQAEYTLKGNNNDCRDIINIRFGSSATSLSLLDKRSGIDLDEWLTGRSQSGVAIWTPSGLSHEFPKIKLIGTPGYSDYIIRYRYRKSNVADSDIPIDFSYLMISGLVARLLPAYEPIFDKDLKTMIDHYSYGGGEDNPVKQDPLVVHRNNRRASKFGWS